MTITELPPLEIDMVEALAELLEDAKKGRIRYFVGMVIDRDGGFWTTRLGDLKYGKPFHMAGHLESLKLSILLGGDDALADQIKRQFEEI